MMPGAVFLRDFYKSFLKLIFSIIFTVLGLIVSLEARALDLTAPFYLESPLVLPSGVRNPRFTNFYMSIDSKYNSFGQIEPLGNPLNKRLKWGEVVDAQKSRADRVLLRSMLNDSQISYDGSPGDSTGVVNTNFNVKVPVFAMGITDRFTLAVAVPVVSVDMSVDTGFKKSPDGDKLIRNLGALNAVEGNAAALKLNQPVQTKLQDYGYMPLQSKSFTNIGDIQLIGKYLLYQDEENKVTSKSTLVVPTGVAPNADLALDLPTGDGRYQVGETLIYGRDLKNDFILNSYAGVLALLPNQMERRIPTVAGDPLSRDKELVTRNLGATFSLGTSLNYSFPSLGLVTAAGYNFQFMTKPSYSGNKYSPERYAYLEDLTPVQALHSATLMAGFSSVEWYQAKKFVYPFQANLVYSRPILGRNVTTNDVVSGELILFF